MEVTVLEIDMSVRAKQKLNAADPMVATPSGMITAGSPHQENAQSSMENTLSGIATEVRFSQE